MVEADIQSRIGGLMAAIEWAGPVIIEPLAGGRNNRVYRLQAGTATFLLKAYFSHPDDPRNRLGTEFAFCRFARAHGLQEVPQAIAADAEQNLGLYSYIEGRPCEEVTDADVTAAMRFVTALQEWRGTAAAAALPDASEPCFTLAAHLACVERRLSRLTAVTDDPDLVAFVSGKLLPAWAAVRDQCCAGADQCDLDIDAELPPGERCLSPSDFGFHNALRRADGELCFIDFEYAGWADPATMVCDFFCQPQRPVSARHWPLVKQTVGEFSAAPEQQAARIELLLDVYRIKWCTTMLNEFLPTAGRRRMFAAGSDDLSVRRRHQLSHAHDYLQRISA